MSGYNWQESMKHTVISGWFYYPAGLFSEKSKFVSKSGHIQRLAPLSAVTLHGNHCTRFNCTVLEIILTTAS